MQAAHGWYIPLLRLLFLFVLSPTTIAAKQCTGPSSAILRMCTSNDHWQVAWRMSGCSVLKHRQRFAVSCATCTALIMTALARHGSHCWTKLKNLWKSGTRRTMDHTQFAVRSLPGTICVQNKTGHWLGRVFELLPYHIHLEQYACQVQHQESSSRVVQSSSELYRFPNFEQERWVWGLLGNFTCIGRVRYYLRCGIL